MTLKKKKLAATDYYNINTINRESKNNTNAIPNTKGFIARVMSVTFFFTSPTSIHCT